MSLLPVLMKFLFLNLWSLSTRVVPFFLPPLQCSVLHKWVDEAAGLGVVVGVAEDLYDAAVPQTGQFAHFVVELQLGTLGVFRRFLQPLYCNLRENSVFI